MFAIIKLSTLSNSVTETIDIQTSCVGAYLDLEKAYAKISDFAYIGCKELGELPEYSDVPLYVHQHIYLETPIKDKDNSINSFNNKPMFSIVTATSDNKIKDILVSYSISEADFIL